MDRGTTVESEVAAQAAPSATRVASLAEVALVDDDHVVRVSGSTSPKQLAQALAHAVYANETPKLRAIGAGAINQAMKALAIAAGYIAPTGKTLLVRPGFETVTVDHKEVSAMTFRMVISD